jgi:hypothetical protein
MCLRDLGYLEEKRGRERVANLGYQTRLTLLSPGHFAGPIGSNAPP